MAPGEPLGPASPGFPSFPFNKDRTKLVAVSIGEDGDENQNEYLPVYRRVLVVLPSLSPLENPEIKYHLNIAQFHI